MMITIPEQQQIEAIKLSPNVSFQWLYDGKAFAITITASTQADVDTYIEANFAALKSWSKEQTFFSLQDVSHENVTITPYFRKRLDETAEFISTFGLNGHSVIVLSNSIMGRIVQIYGRVFAKKAQPIQQHWVIGRDKGLPKLKELVDRG